MSDKFEEIWPGDCREILRKSRTVPEIVSLDQLIKVSIKKLPIVAPPIPETGGRIFMESGELAQIMNGEVISLITYLEFLRESPKPRGHHYHLNKHEILYFISGKVEAVYWDLDSDLMASVILEAGHLVRIAPRCAHVYRALEYAQALELGNAPFDANDTYPTTVDMTHKK